MSDTPRTLEEIFEMVVLQPEETWEKLLEEACAGDRALQSELVKLLEFHKSQCALDRPPIPDSSNTCFLESFGGYRVLRLLGYGGMADVYLAEKDGAQVALKILRESFMHGEAKLRFATEVQALSALTSSHLPKLLEAGDVNGRPFFAMEYCEGESLKEVLAGPALDPKKRIQLVSAICRGVMDLHRAGVVHRDIKPGNILVREINGAWDIKILDLGIASVPGRMGLTLPGDLIGTIEYMSPEQSRGEETTERSDQYSLGVLFREILTGRKTLPEQSWWRKGHTSNLETVLCMATSPSPSKRFDSVEELCRELSVAWRADRQRERQSDHPMGRKRSLALGVLSLWMITSVCVPQGPSLVLEVPQEYSTIQEALEVAEVGNLVLVAPGVYEEDLYLPVGVLLESREGRDQTEIRGTGTRSVMTCSGTGPPALIKGFTISNGNAKFGGGILCWGGAEVWIQDNLIVNNTAEYGGGIAARYNSYPMILENTIGNNTATKEGGGIYIIDGTLDKVVIVRDNYIQDNEALEESGGGGWFGNVDFKLFRNTITGNRASFAGGGIWAGFVGKKLIKNNEIGLNSAEIGGGLWLNEGRARVERNEFENNKAPSGQSVSIGARGFKSIRNNVLQGLTPAEGIHIRVPGGNNDVRDNHDQ